MKNQIAKKILLFFILIGLFLPASVFLNKTRIAQAQIPGAGGASGIVHDPIHTAKTAIGWAWDQRQKVYEWAQKTAGQILKKVLLDRLVDATIAWINRGGQGAIIENWDQFLNKAGEDAVGVFAQSLGAGFLCSPFNVHVQLALLPVEPFSQVTCSLTDIVRNIEAFENDFRNGSWIAYQQTWVPKNNFYGATLIALDAANTARAKAEANAQAQAVAGRGFLSFEKEGYFVDRNGIYKDKNGNLAEPGYTGVRYTKAKRTLTPGDFVGEAAKAVVINTPIDSLIGADDTAKYITAIVNAGINKLTALGVEGLQGIFKKKTSDFTTVTPTAPCATLTGEAFRACLNSNNIERVRFQNDRGIILNQVNETLKPRQDAAIILNQLIIQQSRLVETLQSLAACQPNDVSIAADLDAEQQTLDNLKDSFDSNQTYLEPLQQTAALLSNASAAADWSTLAIQSNNIQPVLDSAAADDFLDAVKKTETEISANLDAKLQSAQTQLATCPTLTPAPKQ